MAKTSEATIPLSALNQEHVIKNAPMGILFLDKDYKIQEVNETFCQMVGKSNTSLVGSLFSTVFHNDDKAHLQSVLKSPVPLEARLQGPKEINVKLIAKSIEHQNSYLVYIIDISDKKHLETQFFQSQKMQAIGQLAGGVAHDFNNLLTGIIGFTDLMLERKEENSSDHSDLMHIKENSERAATLVRQLLAFSRQQTLQPKVLNPVQCTKDLSPLIQRLIDETIKFTITHDDNIWFTKADKSQYDQVILNLVINARDAMPKGGKLSITFKNHVQKTPLETASGELSSGNYILIRVTDTGCGIQKEHISRIFDPFFTTKEKIQDQELKRISGTGLGLSTVYGVVTQSGGQVDVESIRHEGTSFNIYLPRSLPTSTDLLKPSENTTPKKSPRGTGVVLVVEDEEPCRIFSTRALREKGYAVHEASDPETGLKIIEKQGDKIDLLISDVVMAQMDGPTMAKKIRKQYPELRIIFVSGYAEENIRANIQTDEKTFFLPKPYGLKELTEMVRKVIGEKKLKDSGN